LFSYPPAVYEAQPFPHAVIRGAWDEELIRDCKQGVQEQQAWTGERNFIGAEKKRFCSDMEALPFAVQLLIREASSPQFLTWLEALTGERGLIPDPHLQGGGIHSIGTGGFLKLHADFNWHPRLSLYRRLNLLLYLNEWQTEWGGDLELWSRDMKSCAVTVPPHANTMVIFTTDDTSFHGHPHPLTCPRGVTRDSIALYYYTAVQPEGWRAKRMNTDYRACA
jgi:hypothetical protein